MAGNTVIVRVLGNTNNLSAALKRAKADLGGLEQINRNIASGFKIAAVGAAVFGAAAVGAGAVGAAALAGMPALIGGIGIAFAAQSPKVKKAFSTLKSDVVSQMKGFAEPLVQPLVRTAGALGDAFKVISPAIKQTFAATAPLINQFNAGLIPVAKQIKPLITDAFKAGVPVLQAFGRAVTPIIGGVRGFFKALEGGNGSKAFVGFVDQLGTSIGQLLPAFGRFLSAMAPIGTVILSVVVPALVSLMDWIGAKVGPAFSALSGVISEHPTLFKNIGIGVLVLVAAFKAATVGVALYNGVLAAAGLVTGGFSAILTAAAAAQRIMTAAAIGTRIQLALLAVQTAVVKAATVAYTAVQWLLNAAMTANPIGLVVLAIVALVAAFVIAYKKSETFRAIVDKAFSAIKKVVTTVVGAVVGFVKNNWPLLVGIITGPIGLIVGFVIKNWAKIKAATSAAWNAIKSVVSSVVNGVKNAVSNGFNAAKNLISNAWNAAKSLTTAAWNAIKSAVSRGISGLMGFVTSLPGKITSALSGLAASLYSVGVNMIQGMINGVKAMAGNLVGAAKDVVGGAIAGAKSLLGINSPSRVFYAIGRFTGQGMENGLKDSRARVAKAGRDMANAARRGSDRVARDWNKKGLTAVLKQTQKELAKAKEGLKDLQKAARDFSKNIAGAAIDYGSITNLNAGFTAEAMLQQMQDRVKKVLEYNRLLASLARRGLNKTMLRDLAEAGVEGGLATATAIANGGKNTISQFNKTQKQLNDAGRALGQTTKNALYKAGVQAAQGLVNGLNRKKAQLVAVARRMGNVLTKELKKTLGIHSPSRVFARLGEQTTKGLEVGLKDLSGVKRAVVNIGDAMTNSFQRPALMATAGAGGGRGGDTITINVNVPVSANKAETGRAVADALDEYYKQGGRRRA